MVSLTHGLELGASAALAPLLFVQGRYVRRTTPVLPEAEGPREGELGSGPLLRLLVAGDSSAAGVGVDAQERALAGRITARLADQRRVDWTLIARTGATTAGTLRRLAESPRREHDVAVSALGVNDVTNGRTIRGWLADQERLVDLFRERFGARLVVLSGLPPVHTFPALPQPLRWALGARARRFDQALRGLVEQLEDCEYVPVDFDATVADMASDGFHPGAGIYAPWGASIAERILGRSNRLTGDS